MSNNEGNSSTIFDYEWPAEAITEMKKIRIAEFVIVITGTLLNVWFLIAILTSREMRSRLRNQLICSTFLANLLDGAVIIPVSLAADPNNCEYMSAIDVLRFIQDFIANWLIVLLLVVFVAQIQDINLRSKLSPKAVKLGTIGLLALPWVASLIVVLSTAHYYYHNDESEETNCFKLAKNSFRVLKYINVVIPIILAALLLILAAVLRNKRSTQRTSSDSRGPEIDNIFAYVVAVVVFTLCDFLLMILYCNMQHFFAYGVITWLRLNFAGFGISDARLVLLTLPWLLLPDFRQRIKTWRPWNRSTPRTDPAVTYTKDENLVNKV